ncbi:MAG: 4Fe-4S dicluster domain-containing protein [Candidatus Stahlbacteria bacterium]|nr:4Fe-4S dicluster domain-containing protein [Candidatus Stahlbacteria bacterium]
MRLQLKGKLKNEFVKKIEKLSGENLSKCYQCGRCSGGCPSAPFMDLLPNQVMRFAQIGSQKEVLGAKTVWLCASCFTCMVRCPKGVDLARVMEAIRQISLRQNVDYISPNKLPIEKRTELPLIALVSAFRKSTA